MLRLDETTVAVGHILEAQLVFSLGLLTGGQ